MIVNEAKQVLDSPKLIDLPIIAINDTLTSNLSWLTNAYGLAEKRSDEAASGNQSQKNNRRYYFPAYPGQGEEFIVLFPDSLLENHSFFVIDNDDQDIDYKFGDFFPTVKCKLSLIAFFNLKDVYPANWETRNQNNVLSDIINALSLVTLYGLTIGWGKPKFNKENVYKEFSYQDIPETNLMRPYGCLRLTGDLYYKQEC